MRGQGRRKDNRIPGCLLHFTNSVLFKLIKSYRSASLKGLVPRSFIRNEQGKEMLIAFENDLVKK